MDISGLERDSVTGKVRYWVESTGESLWAHPVDLADIVSHGGILLHPPEAQEDAPPPQLRRRRRAEPADADSER